MVFFAFFLNLCGLYLQSLFLLRGVTLRLCGLCVILSFSAFFFIIGGADVRISVNNSSENKSRKTDFLTG